MGASPEETQVHVKCALKRHLQQSERVLLWYISWLRGVVKGVLRPWSVDSLHGGFVASQICPVGRSKIKNKIKFCQPIFFSYLWNWSRSVGRKKKDNIWDKWCDSKNTFKIMPIGIWGKQIPLYLKMSEKTRQKMPMIAHHEKLWFPDFLSQPFIWLGQTNIMCFPICLVSFLITSLHFFPFQTFTVKTVCLYVLKIF